MKTLKTIGLLIAVTLQFSTSCFSQDSIQDYTNLEITELANYISNLKAQNCALSASISNEILLSFDNEINNVSGNILSDLIIIALDNEKEAIKLANYIIWLEKTDLTDETAIVKQQFESIALIIVIEKNKNHLIKDQLELSNIKNALTLQ